MTCRNDDFSSAWWSVRLPAGWFAKAEQHGATLSLLALVLLVLVVLVPRSPSFSQDVSFVSLMSSPIQMTLNEKTGFVEISIKSQAEIAAYRFGCVTRSATGFILKKRFERVVVDFAKRDYFINRASLEDQGRRCSANDSLAVVEVEFRDGGSWKVRK
jgi:hypothetical protein